GWTSMSTMQQPHCSSPQPKRVPVSLNSLRSTSSSGVSSFTATTSTGRPLTVNAMFRVIAVASGVRVLRERKGVVIGALHAAARQRTAARYVHHVPDHGGGCAVQAVTRDRHRRECLPTVGSWVVGFISAEYPSGCFAAEHHDPALYIDSRNAAARRRQRRAKCPGVSLRIID